MHIGIISVFWVETVEDINIIMRYISVNTNPSASYQNDGIQPALTYWGRDTIIAHDILIYIFMNGNVWISLKISPNIVSKALI